MVGVGAGAENDAVEQRAARRREGGDEGFV